MRRWQQLICSYLALSLALGGMVGLSPVLHRLIEHGNHGPAHTHWAGTVHRKARPLGHQHGAGWHSHSNEVPASNPATIQKRPFSHQHEFLLPAIDWVGLWHEIGRFLADQPSSGPGENPEHHHDSLFQLLAGGLIEYSLEAPAERGPAALIALLIPRADSFRLVRDWEAPTASRAPPAIVG